MKKYAIAVIGILGCMMAISPLWAQVNPYPPQQAAGQIALGGPVQNGDCFIGQRTGKTLCISWPPGQSALPIATSTMFGAVKPDNVTIGVSAGILSVLTTGATGAASGDLSGVYPGPSVIGIAHVTTGILGVANGGLGRASPTAHAIIIGNGSSAVTALAASATAGWIVTSNGSSSDPSYQAPPASSLPSTSTAAQMLQSTAVSATTTWSASKWPLTTTINQLLYSSATNTVGGVTACNSGVISTTSGGVPQCSTTPVATDFSASAFKLTTTEAVPAGITGVFSTSAGALSLSTSGTASVSISASRVLTVSGNAYPTVTGTAGQFMQTNGSGTLSFASNEFFYSGGSLGVGVLQATTAYMWIGSNAAEAMIYTLLPSGTLGAGTNGGLRIKASAGLTSGQTAAFTLRKNGVDTAITCTITGPSDTCSDTTHTVAAAGEVYNFKIVTSATAGTESYNFTLSQTVP